MTETRPSVAPPVSHPTPVLARPGAGHSSRPGAQQQQQQQQHAQLQMTPDSFEDARVLLEKLQHDVLRQGSCAGLQGQWPQKSIPSPLADFVHCCQRRIEHQLLVCAHVTLIWRLARFGLLVSVAVVALSGGTGSALVAYLLASVFEDRAVACIGTSPSLPAAQLIRARYVADALGAP